MSNSPYIAAAFGGHTRRGVLNVLAGNAFTVSPQL